MVMNNLHQLGSHSVTCHLTQVNTPAITPSRQALLHLPTPDEICYLPTGS